MTGQQISAEEWTRKGFEAIRAKDLPAALDAFRAATQGPGASAEAFLGLALTELAHRNHEAFGDAIDRALALEPQNPKALVLKGDALMHDNNRRAALPFYRAALSNAPANPPPSLKRDLDRAAAMVASLAQDLEDFLRAELEKEGFNPSTSSPRFALALDLMTGRRERNPGPQQPRMFFLPGLAEHGFYPRDKLAWLPALEDATSTLKGELSNVLRDTGSFAPYVMPETNAPQRDYQGMAGNQDWSAYYLWKNGAEVPANMAQCPQTTAILSQMPLCDMPQRAPMALFSWLKPGARIPPHQGMMNTRLICHLPLIVPADCGFRVGAETRHWEEGRAWAFDDTFDHEAWNRSTDLRVILIFDVWRPDVTPEERHLIRSMLAAIDTYAGVPPRWEI